MAVCRQQRKLACKNGGRSQSCYPCEQKTLSRERGHEGCAFRAALRCEGRVRWTASSVPAARRASWTPGQARPHCGRCCMLWLCLYQRACALCIRMLCRLMFSLRRHRLEQSCCFGTLWSRAHLLVFARFGFLRYAKPAVPQLEGPSSWILRVRTVINIPHCLRSLSSKRCGGDK